MAITGSWLTGFAFTAALAFLLGYSVESYNQLTLERSGRAAFDLAPMIGRAMADPFGEGFWLSSMTLMPILPAVIVTASFVTDGLLALQPNDYRFRNLLFRTLGVSSALALLIGTIAFVALSDEVNIAPLLGDLARNGLDTAPLAVRHPTPN